MDSVKGKNEKGKILNIKIPAEIHKMVKIQSAIEGILIREVAAKAIEEYCEKARAKALARAKEELDLRIALESRTRTKEEVLRQAKLEAKMIKSVQEKRIFQDLADTGQSIKQIQETLTQKRIQIKESE